MASRTTTTPPPVIVEDGDGAIVEAAPEVNGDIADATSLSVEELQAQLKAARDAQAAAERERDQERQARQSQNGDLTDARTQVIENAIELAKSEKTAIMAKIRAAKESGDYDAEVNATDELSQINVKMRDLEKGRDAIKGDIERRKEIPADPVEAFKKSLTPKSAAWVDEHPEVVDDLDALSRAHSGALYHGIRPESREYFAFIEKEMKLGNDDDAPSLPKETRRSTTPPAAPPSRGGSQVNGAGSLGGGIEELGPGKYRLNAEAREFARAMNMTDKEYLDNHLALRREGKLNTH